MGIHGVHCTVLYVHSDREFSYWLLKCFPCLPEPTFELCLQFMWLLCLSHETTDTWVPVGKYVAANPEPEKTNTILKLLFYQLPSACPEPLLLGYRPRCGSRYSWFYWPSENGEMAFFKTKQQQRKTFFTLFCRTTRRPQTFYDGSHSCARGVCHISVAEPFCPKTREVCALSERYTKINYKGLG